MNALVRAPVAGEILGPADVITVTAAVHPLKPHAEILILPAGLSLAEIVDEVAQRCHVSRLARGADVSVSGHAIDQVLWSRVRVKSGAHVTVRARAGKAIGGILKSVLMIALSVAASFIVGPAGLGIAAAIGGTAGQVVASLAAGAIMMAGGFALNALFPPTQTRSESNNPSYSISAGRNGASKWGPIPVVLGKVRALPKYAALPYTEFEGDDQYLRLLFVWGYGPMNIEDIRIGDTSIAEFEGVEIETFEGYGNDPQQTIYPSEVVQDDLSIDPAYNVPVTRTSAENVDEIVLDFVAPAGLCHVSKKGKRQSKVVDFKVEMSPAGANAWVNKGNVQLQGATNDPVRRSFRYVVSKGRYDIRITRLTGDENTTTDFSEVTWTAIKSFRVGDPPISFGKPLAITALRIKASKQLNGMVDTLNALVTSVGKSWNGTSWVEAQETRNPGDLMRLVLQGPANARAVSDSRLDLSGLAAFADHCRAKGYTFDMYRDFTASVRDTLRDIAAAGRGVPTFRDGKWSVTWEDASAPVVQHFTPRNSRDFRWSQTYRTLPQGLRCKFVNADKDYIEDELLCFADGYNKDNAKLYEQAEFPGVTSGELVYKHGLYRHADAKERPAVYSFSVDFEHLVAQRGDRVAMAYDVVRQGIASGRIQAVAGQQLTLDEPAIMESGKLYGIRIRRRDGTSIVRQVTTNPGTRTVITITGTPPEAGDLYTFGIRDQETGIYRILRIRPGSDLSAEVDLVDDGPNVQTGDSSTDIPSGSVTPPAPVSSLTPFGLRAESFVQAGEVGRTYVVRLYWQPVLGPDYTSFEVIGTSDPGIVRKVVAGDQQVAEFENIQSGLWSFTVRGLMSDGGYTLPSAPLVVPVEVPYDDVGIEFDDIAAEVDQHVTEMLDWLDSDSPIYELGQEVSANTDAIVAERSERMVDVGGLADRWRSLYETVNRTAFALSDTMLAQKRDLILVREELVSVDETGRAFALDQIQLAVGPGSALAERLTTIEGQADANYVALSGAIQTVQSVALDAVADEATARQALRIQLVGNYTGNDIKQVTQGLLYQSQQGWISETEALAEQVGLLSVNVGNASLFNQIIGWAFADSVLGWSGNGAPSIDNGWLTPANHGSEPYLVSPAGLGVQGSRYQQVRLYIRKIGSPTWAGRLWWKATGDATWDASRRVDIAEPAFVDGVAAITVNVGWVGTIEQVRLDLTSAQSSGQGAQIKNFYIGEPAAGFSQAQASAMQQALASQILAEASSREALSVALTGLADPTGATIPSLSQGLIYDESVARVTGDEANTLLIQGVAAQIDDPSTGLDALAQVQSTMQGQISSLDGVVTVMGQSIDDLVLSVDDLETGKADIGITDGLQAQINQMGGGEGLSLIAEAIRSMHLTVEKLALGQAGVWLAGQNDRRELGNIVADVHQQTTSRIDATDDQVTLHGQILDRIRLDMGGLADLDAVQALDGRVTATESGIENIGQSILQMRGTIGDLETGKADASVLVNYRTKLDSYSKTETQEAATNAAAEATTTLSSALTPQIEEALGKSGTALDALAGYTAPQAVATAMLATNTAVSELGGVVSAQASRTDELFAAAGGDENSIRAKWEVLTGPNGYTRYGLRLLTSAGAQRAITMFGDVPNDPAKKTKWMWDAQEFAFIDTSSGEVSPNFLIYADGAWRLSVADIGLVRAGTVESPNGKHRYTVSEGTMEWWD
ncbi:hypothetical protein HNR59_001213 [Aquamicrobium lusatiense]|uniref:Tip attachment protein J HDII-ins2 domain-containing protein n=1 Tax=Aquamicrobium lusatiense TaxID=89772 RepID=A0A7W9VUC7_9HYPH|nr:host specificity factor TipJ family phage tail protein [Aquamicrobium lusatiense]MBB6011868.1 hypothetical protein [Aquamicrobium lusatiense]